MQPDQWPKYKYLFLELWKPSNDQISEFVNTELNRCRSQVLQAFVDKKKKEWLVENQKHEESMTKADHRHVIKVAEDLYKKMLANLNQRSFPADYFETLREDLSSESTNIGVIDEENWGDNDS
jgi:hypothetical protein